MVRTMEITDEGKVTRQPIVLTIAVGPAGSVHLHGTATDGTTVAIANPAGITKVILVGETMAVVVTSHNQRNNHGGRETIIAQAQNP